MNEPMSRPTVIAARALSNDRSRARQIGWTFESRAMQRLYTWRQYTIAMHRSSAKSTS